MEEKMTGSPVSLIRLDNSHINDAAETLANAFWNYPLNRYFYPDDTEQKRMTVSGFRSVVKRSVLYGEAYSTSDYMEGVVLWLPSKQLDMNIWQRFRSGDIAKEMKESRGAKKRVRTFYRYTRMLHGQLVPDEHMFLWVIGVAPEFQGNGLSSRLMKPMLSRLDEQNLPCFVETHAENNVPLYQHFGFKIVDESIIPGASLQHWALLREPAPARK